MATSKVLINDIIRQLKPYCLSGLLIIFFLLSNLSLLADNITAMSEPEWLFKPKLNPIKPHTNSTVSDGYYLEYLDVQVNLGTQTSYRHYIRHIINESGVQNASEVSVSFDPAYQKVIFHSITLIRNGQRINQLKLDQIRVVQEETDAENFQYNGTKRAFIILKGTQKDDRIDYAYSIVGFNPVFQNHFTDKIYFSSDDEISNYFQTYIVPAGRQLVFNTYNNAPKPLEIRQDNMIIYHWDNPPLKMYESQSQVPGWFNNYPCVEISEFKNWKEVADWGINLFNHYQYEIPADLKSKIAKWRVMSKGDKEMFANLATRFVQDEVRYLGLETGIYSHKPHQPSDVFQQRYGDCKDKALLLTTILRQENIPAFVALVSTVRRSQLQYATPSIDDFDHAIVAVERTSGFLFIDATMNFQRGEFSTTYIPDYGFALLVKEGEDKLQPIEPGYPNTTDISERLILPLKDSSRMYVTTIYKGGAADKFRADIAEMSSKELGLSCLRYYEKHLDGIRQVKTVETSDDSARNELELKEEYVMPALWKENEKGKISIDVFAKPVYEKIPDPTGSYAGGPIAIEFPLTLKYTLSLELDEDYSFPVEDLHYKTSSYQFDFTSAVNGNQVELTYYYKTFKDHIPQNEVADYKVAYDKMESDMSFNFSLAGSIKPKSGKDGSTAPDINWFMLLATIMAAGSMIPVFRKLDVLSSEQVTPTYSAERIGGWVAFLGMSLFVGLLVQLFAFVKANYYDNLVWAALGSSGGQYLQFVFVMELMYAVLGATFLTFLLYWFMNRRDIFPRMFIGYVIGMVAGQFILIMLYVIAHYRDPSFEVQQENIVQLIRTIVYGAVWTSFVHRSVRAKNTFVVRKEA